MGAPLQSQWNEEKTHKLTRELDWLTQWQTRDFVSNKVNWQSSLSSDLHMSGIVWTSPCPTCEHIYNTHIHAHTHTLRVLKHSIGSSPSFYSVYLLLLPLLPWGSAIPCGLTLQESSRPAEIDWVLRHPTLWTKQKSKFSASPARGWLLPDYPDLLCSKYFDWFCSYRDSCPVKRSGPTAFIMADVATVLAKC